MAAIASGSARACDCAESVDRASNRGVRPICMLARSTACLARLLVFRFRAS